MKRQSKQARPKAVLGVAAASLIGSGLSALTGLFGSKSSADAQLEAAKYQAEAIKEQSKIQAESMQKQIDNQNQLQQEAIDFTRNENERNRLLQTNIQMRNQMIAGKENVNDVRRQNLIQLKHGGRKRLKRQYPLQGGQPFTVTDGGTAIPLGQTSLGNLIYELYGNDHNHYHKAQGGKHKTGVGLKFKDGVTVEGEGNQNSNRGELVMIDPTGSDARFISKHNVPGTGFNPRLAIEQGMSPEEAFAYQEQLKAIQGIDSEGHTIHPRRRNGTMKATFGTSTFNIPGVILNDNIVPNIAMVPSYTTRTLKCGGRHKFYPGGEVVLSPFWVAPEYNYTKYSLPAPKATPTQSNNPYVVQPSSATTNNNGNGSIYSTTPQAPRLGNYMLASGISAAGGLLGNLLTNWGNNRAANYLSDAYSRAADIMADAYSRMGGIDMSELRREDYNPAHALAAVRSARYNINPQLEDVARQEREAIRQTNRGTLSSAARLNRLANIQAAGNQERSKLYAQQANEIEKINQLNNQQINQMANENANRDVEAMQDYGRDRMALLQYNNDIENAKIAGIAQARSGALTNIGQVRANNAQTNAASWGNTIAGIGNQFAGAFDIYNKARADYYNTMFGAPLSTQMLARLPNMPNEQLEDIIARLANATDVDGIFVRNEAQNILNSRKS